MEKVYSGPSGREVVVPQVVRQSKKFRNDYSSTTEIVPDFYQVTGAWLCSKCICIIQQQASVMFTHI